MGDNMLEVLFSCATDDNQLSCTAWDFRNSTNLMSYKGGGGVQAHGLCILGSEYIISANNAKPLLHVWPINAQEQIAAVRFVVPGRVSSLALSPDGYYLIAGIQETIYIWHLTTGHMLNTISKHYQPINCIRFTDDGSHFVSAGQDGSVLVWNLTQVVSRTNSDDNQSPVYSFSDHGLPVTDVHVGAGGMRCYIFTVSMDRTSKVYDLNSGTLLLSVVFGEGLRSVIANALETCVYVGTCEGNIYEFHINSLPRTKEYHLETDHTKRFLGHTVSTAVNCLVVSLDGQTLVSGGNDQQVCIWHIPSRQLLKTMTHKGAVTNLILRLTTLEIFNPEHKQPHFFSGNLCRMLNSTNADEENIVEVLVTEQNITQDGVILPRGALSQSSIPVNKVADVGSTNSPVIPINVEVEKLRVEIQHLKRVNKKLFEVSTKQLLARSKK